jgi:ferredoxin
MLANYGYSDGSGEFYITVDTDRCDGCGDCVPACPAAVLVVQEDDNDPLRDEPVAAVAVAHRKKLKDSCVRCKPDRDRPPLPCVAACPVTAVSHSW